VVRALVTPGVAARLQSQRKGEMHGSISRVCGLFFRLSYDE
jgi:hypothetical protein